MNDYINKRRKFLEQKKEEENYKNRKLGQNTINYNARPTILKKFDLKTEKKNKSNEKERDLNITIKNNKKGLYNLKRDIINEDCKNNFNNKEMKNNSIMQSQQAFINAVNFFHNTIDKLDI